MIWTLRFWHWRGVSAKLNEYADASSAVAATSTNTGSMRGVAGKGSDKEEREIGILRGGVGCVGVLDARAKQVNGGEPVTRMG